MQVIPLLPLSYFFSLGDGEEFQLWEDKWLGDFALHDHFPHLYRPGCIRNGSIPSSIVIFPFEES